MSGQSLVLGLTQNDAAHLVVALQQYRKRCAVDHMPYPPALREMEGQVSSGVMRGQDGSTFAEALAALNSVSVSRELLDYRQAAQMLSCSLSTIKRRVAAGELTPVRNGGITRLKVDDLKAYIDRGASAC